MKHHHHEVVEELKKLHVSLPETQDKPIYDVPADYFKNLPEEILSTIKDYQTTKHFPNRLPFLLPAHYFDTLADYIKANVLESSVNWEMEDLSAFLADLKNKKMPFHRPGNYSVEQAVKDKLLTESVDVELKLLSPFLADLKNKKMPFHRPENYSVEEEVKEKALEPLPKDEIENLSPLLAGLKNVNPFERPNDNQAKEKKAKIVDFPQPDTHEKPIKWMSWVAAAAVICIFTLGGYGLLIPQTQNNFANMTIEQALSTIPDSVVQNYLNESMDDYDLFVLTAGESNNGNYNEYHRQRSVKMKKP